MTSNQAVQIILDYTNDTLLLSKMIIGVSIISIPAIIFLAYLALR